MRASLLLAILSTVICVSVSASAGTWHVDGAVPSSGDGKSWETALKTVQQGINAASHGDTVLVAQGTYLENIHFDGKSIVLTSTDPLNPSVVANTIIDGNQAGSVVTFSGTETGACVLSGFTIRNGKAADSGICGGTWENQSHATIQNCVITANSDGAMCLCSGIIRNNTIIGNSGSYGAGLAVCNGTVENNIIGGNTAKYDGGGLSGCDGTVHNNTITDNSAQSGGGLSGCGGTIQNNTIAGNSAGAYGGGLYGCGGTLENNAIAGNSAQNHGGGLAYCSGVLQNNTIVDNSAKMKGGGVYLCEGVIRNCIIWTNTAGVSGSQIADSNTPSYSCIQGWAGGGSGNTNKYPIFVDPLGPDQLPETVGDNDYRLQSGSSCVDVGIDFYWFTWPQRDLDGNCRLSGEHVDLGCYEHGASPDHDGDLLSDEDELAVFTDPYQADTDEDGLRDGLELLRGSNALEPTAPGVLNVPSEIATIQQCLCASVAGDEVIVAPGTYWGNLQFCGADIILRSSDPGDLNVARSTILDGGGVGPVVRLMGGESEACMLAGFTIRNGQTAVDGGGVFGGRTYETAGSHANIKNNTITGNTGGGLSYCDGTIQNNTITGNSGGQWGGGLYRCDGTIQNNVITGNSVQGLYSSGGALYQCNGTIQNNTITHNSAEWDGGGLDNCNGTIQNNTITANSSWNGGGGVVSCYGRIQNNTITDNSAFWGGGLCGCEGTIQNNRITGNCAALNGGGLYGCDGMIQNNTITGNSAGQWGGGLYLCTGAIRNCILWGNAARTGPQLYESSIPRCSCIERWSGGGEGNTASEPRFLDLNAGDYRLQEGSPCIDAGYNDPSLPATDIAGMHRIMFGGRSLTVDIGAYEFHIWPPTENLQTGEVTLKWSSLAGRIYTVYHSSDMFTWDALADNVSSAGDTVTTWIDSTAPVLPPAVRRRYYKVMENP